MRTRPGTVLAHKVKGSDNVRLCERCGIQRGGVRSDSKLCADCRSG